jgi:SAM-dependent methyltransferase
MKTMVHEAPRQFGNLEANLRFIDQTGVVMLSTRVLEIGAGTGAVLHALQERGCDVQGVELCQELIDEARRWFGPLPIQQVSGVELPFPDGSFDVVMSFDVFEHIPDSDAHLRAVKRVLRAGGAYLIQTPNKWTNVVFETIRWKSFTRFREDHCSLHTLGELKSRLARHGFNARVHDVPVVNDFFRQKVGRYMGPLGLLALRLANPDRLPLSWRTNLWIHATKDSGSVTAERPSTSPSEPSPRGGRSHTAAAFDRTSLRTPP